jgi:ABC exporter DevB family membrane fusion protein
MAELAAHGDIAAERLDNARAELNAAEAQARAAGEREALINAPALPEEIGRAEADVRSAEQRLQQAQARFEKCTVRAPMTATVLRCHKKAGEAVSTVFPEPIVSVMDTSRIRVRAEVDERDIGRVRPGQKVMVIGESFADTPFPGRVAGIGAIMGRKRVLTGDPAEKSDRDILEVLADIDSKDERLIVGLRVTVQFLNLD